MRTRAFKPLWILGALSLCGLALAANTALKLSLNGAPTSSSAIVVNGKIFIPLEALQKAGVTATTSKTEVRLELPGAQNSAQNAGGANARPSLEGCLGETLFNGVWRVKTLKLEAITKDGATPGWGLTVEVRNGTKTTLGLTDAGVDGTGQGIQLAFSNATTISVDPMEVQKLTFEKLPAGGAVTQQLKFYYPFGRAESAAQQPVKFLLEIDSKGIGDSTRAKGVAFSVPNPSLRARLDCQR